MAKKGKGGLGRGLNSLIGGYEAAVEPQRRTVEREVIREENLDSEDRAVIDREKRASARPAQAGTNLQGGEFIEEDGVTIKGVVDRPAATAKETPVAAAPASGTDAAASVRSDEAVEVKDSTGVGMMAEVDISSIVANPDQPRTYFKPDELEELAASIDRDGLLQPILVRRIPGGKYEIIAGERRWQASRLAGLKKIPIRIKEADDMKVLELALIENLQRSDLNPIEEAYGYRRMMDHGARTQAEVAAAVSKGRSTIANALRLLDLPEEAQRLLFEEKITAGHARAILSIPSEEGRLKLTEKLSTEKMSVREAESLARLMAGKENAASKPPKPAAPPLYKKAARSLGSAFHTKVRIKTSNGKNRIEIEFKDEEDLQRIFDMMNGREEGRD